METVACSSGSLSSGCAATVSQMRCATAVASASVASRSSTVNSSPPVRASRSVGRRQSDTRRENAFSVSSPTS
jgi:hypothetical protein